MRRTPLKRGTSQMKRGKMTCTIPPKMRGEMAADPYYSKCAITGETGDIEWHHALIWQGKRVNAKFCIIPLAKWVHEAIVNFKEKCDWIMWNRASEEELDMYSKAVNYRALRDRLNLKYGNYKP